MSSLEELYQLLNADGINIDTIELAESLWLSQHISKTDVISSIDKDAIGTLDNTPIQKDDNLSSNENKSPINTSKVKQANQQVRKDVPLHPISDEIGKDSLPFRIPLIRKLYKDNDLIYAFRHFRQKIISLEKSKLDEDKIADYMAKTDIFRPFYKKVYEKRFSILFIVDNSSSMKIWESLIEQFIKDINNYHIFKKVTVNYIYTDSDSPELFKKKEKISKLNNKWYQHSEPNTLIFMFSDMMSKSWDSGKLLSDITLWQQYLHFAIVQMLPQRLWTGTKLIDASIGKMSNHKKFAHNIQLVSRVEEILSIEEDSLPELVKIPLLNFNESSIDAYGRVINALSNNRIEGAVFEKEDFQGEYQFLKSNNNIKVEKRLRSFYKYASSTSKKLLELLAIVPLSMPIIKLIQQELLPNSSQEHLSEVFMSGIIDKEHKIDGFYQFYRVENEKTGVREELIKKIGAKKAFQTIVAISKVIQRQGGVFDFFAYIVDPNALKQSDCFSEIDREFARISITVLNEMGEQYKDLADRLQDCHVKDNENSNKSDIPNSEREQSSKNNSNKFVSTWKDIFSEEVGKPYFKKLQKFLNEEEKSDKTILPKKEDWYKSLDSTKFSSVKVVILGASPYHGIGQADGLAYSVLSNTKIPPSLSNIFKELKDDLNIDYNDVGNLQYWAKQGVLLLNSVFTVEENKANSHTNKGWEIFTSKILEAINNERENIVFILWGTPSQKLSKNIDESKHLIIKSPHPSPLSAYRGFFNSKPFSRTNDYLQAHNIKSIDWSLPKIQEQLIQDDENIIEKTIGKVTFDCEKCNTVHALYCKELDWEQVGGSKRNMGSELEYEAEYYDSCHNCNSEMSITFNCWEYPIGVENYRDVSSQGIANLKGNCCLELNASDEEYIEDYDEPMVDKDTSYSSLEEKKEELETFLNNLVPFAELEYTYDSEDFSNEKDIPLNQFLISREFDSVYLDDLIDEIQEDINEVEFTISHNTSDNLANNINNNALLLKKQYTIEYDGISSAYGVDIDCNVYEEDREQILYIYPSNNKIESNEDLFALDEEEHLAVDKVEVVPEMEEWFFENYDDPVNFLPYETKEDGFQYLYGGPYELDEIMYDQFGGTYPDEYIKEVIKDIEHEHGNVGWGKRPPENKEYVEAEYISREYRESTTDLNMENHVHQKLYIPANGKVYEFDVNNKYYDIKRYEISEQVIKDFQGLQKMINETGATHQGSVNFKNDIKGNIKELNKLIKDFQDIFGQEKGLSFYSIVYSEDDTYKFNNNVDADNIINEQIDGEFEGWDGNSIIKLTNGEVWKQSEYYYEYFYAFMPNVTITNSQTGYKMKVDGVNNEVGVEKLENVIESKIHGSFSGWGGDTIVELINGEKWKQSTYKYSYSYAYRPDIIIYQSDYGFKMKVDGNDETVDVERVI